MHSGSFPRSVAPIALVNADDESAFHRCSKFERPAVVCGSGTDNLLSRAFTVVMRPRPPTMAAARWRNGRRRGDGAPSQTLVQFQAGPPIFQDDCGRCSSDPGNPADADFDHLPIFAVLIWRGILSIWPAFSLPPVSWGLPATAQNSRAHLRYGRSSGRRKSPSDGHAGHRAKTARSR